ncbi:hypothetical protein [Virgibacillus sp. DJP39]|uniref:hypothetical protein n=1 Tax=Virgibacillus sp. DJP39 TaxID=3409790 RepID=UPI003BB61B1A
MKRFLGYFSLTVVIGALSYLGTRYQVLLEKEVDTYYQILPVLVYSTIFPIVIGFFLRLPKLMNEMKEKKRWTFDWVKIVALTLPALCITMLPLLSYIFGMNLIMANELFVLNEPTYAKIAGIVFGYSLLDSLKK